MHERRVARQSLRILEIFIVESNHVLSRNVIRLGVRVHHPHTRASCDGIEHLLERNRGKPAVLNRDHGGCPAVKEMLSGTIPEIAGVFDVVGNRIGAAQLIPDVL